MIQRPEDREQKTKEARWWEWRRTATKILSSGGMLVPFGGITLICFVFFLQFQNIGGLDRQTSHLQGGKEISPSTQHNLNLALTLKVNQFWKKN